jgi:hypothetical protein
MVDLVESYFNASTGFLSGSGVKVGIMSDSLIDYQESCFNRCWWDLPSAANHPLDNFHQWMLKEFLSMGGR